MKTYILPILAASAVSANAAIITGVSAAAFSNFSGNANSINIAQTVNGSNLSSPVNDDADLLTVVHGNDPGSSNQWHSAVNQTAGNVDFTLNSGVAIDVGSIWIWNHNQVNDAANGGAGIDLTDRGVQNFTLSYSTDGGATYTQVGGTNTLTESAGAVGANVSVGAEGFDIGQTGVTNVRIDIIDNYGGNVVGLSEVRFSSNSVAAVNTTAVPEPSASALLGLGGLALILRRRK